MTAGQPLRGFVGQGMNGRRPNFVGAATVYPSGTWTFVAAKSGRWKFVLWGAGGDSSSIGNASGAYIEKTFLFTKGQTATVVVGGRSVDSSVTLPDGSVVTAGRASGVTPGVATGGDVNLNGSPGTAGGTSADGAAGLGTGGGAGGVHDGTTDGGAGAPAMLPFHGGAGASGVGGQAGHGAGTAGSLGAQPIGIVVYVRD